MTYELAKWLSEAGWKPHIYLYDETEEFGNAPTLTELIEACGDDFISLSLYIPGRDKNTADRMYWADSLNHSMGGITPEEAVARLWLALNKK